MNGKCTVYFDDPFWMGVFERNDENGYSVARVCFGAEPSDAEMLEFSKTQFDALSYSRAQPGTVPDDEKESYKRRQRRIRKEMTNQGAGTYAQRAIQAEYERSKGEHQAERSQTREEEAREKYLRRKAERKEKHRGR